MHVTGFWGRPLTQAEAKVLQHNTGRGRQFTGFRDRLTQADAKVLQHNKGPGRQVTGFRSRLTPAQAEAGAAGGRREEEARKKQNLNQGVRQKTN